MENASKALIMAGGVLIAIMVIATLIYAASQWGLFSNTQDNSEEIEQLVSFNKQYESYDKQNIYGADVITVINKAHENNERYGITANPNDDYFVDVKVHMKTNVEGYNIVYERDATGNEIKHSPEYTGVILMYANRTYSLSNVLHYSSIFKGLSSDIPVSVVEENRGKKYYKRTETYADVNEFRLKYFTCTNLQYNNINGRVKLIEFTELLPNEVKKLD